MQVSIGWLFLVTPVVFTLGLFVGENWSRWDRASRRKYQDEHEDWWESGEGKPDWFKRQAD